MENENKELEDIENFVKNLENSITEIRKNPSKDPNISNIQILLNGVKDKSSLDFLFSSGLDKLLDKFLDLAIGGEFDLIISKVDSMEDMINKFGIGEYSFEGEISKTIINTIDSSMSSEKFNKLNSKIKKALLILKNLKAQTKKFEDPETKKKYKDAVYAIKKIMMNLAKIYKIRNSINSRVKSGLKSIVNE